MTGDLTIHNTTSSIDFTPIDILKNLHIIDAIFFAHVEVQHQRWALMVDPTYFKLTVSGAVGPIPISLTPEITIFDFGAFYTITNTDTPLYLFNKPIVVQLFAGGRYFKMKAALTLPLLPVIAGSVHVTSPIIGGRIMATITPRIHLILRGDAGGMSVDNVKNTWSWAANADYDFNNNVALAVGFKMLGMNFTKTNGAKSFGFNAKIWGPMFGIILRSGGSD